MRGRGGGGGAAGPSTKGGRGGRAGPGARARADLGSPEEHGWAGPGFGVGWASRSSLRACGRSSPQFPSLHCCTAREGRGKSRSAVHSPTPTLPFADLDHMGTFSAGDGPFRRPTRASWTQHVPSGRGERGQDRHARGRRAGRRERGEGKQGSRAAGRRRRSVSALGPRCPSPPGATPRPHAALAAQSNPPSPGLVSWARAGAHPPGWGGATAARLAARAAGRRRALLLARAPAQGNPPRPPPGFFHRPGCPPRARPPAVRWPAERGRLAPPVGSASPDSRSARSCLPLSHSSSPPLPRPSQVSPGTPCTSAGPPAAAPRSSARSASEFGGGRSRKREGEEHKANRRQSLLPGGLAPLPAAAPRPLTRPPSLSSPAPPRYELGRQPAMTKLSSNVTVRRVRVRGGHFKFRALRLDAGNFSWGSEVRRGGREGLAGDGCAPGRRPHSRSLPEGRAGLPRAGPARARRERGERA